jgi:hypothetical protein
MIKGTRQESIAFFLVGGLGQVQSLSVSGILTPNLIFSFVLLAAFPWVVRKIMEKVKAHRIMPRENPITRLIAKNGMAGIKRRVKR